MNDTQRQQDYVALSPRPSNVCLDPIMSALLAGASKVVTEMAVAILRDLQRSI